jgi:hypothetical protein
MENQIVLIPWPLFIEPPLKSMVKVYPNPAKGILYVESDKVQAGMLIELKDLSGRLVLKKEMTKSPEIIKLDKLQNGTYLLDVQWAKGKYSTRVILK